GLRLGPVVEVLLAAARGQAPHVRPLAVALLEALLGGVAVLVFPVVVLLGDAEVDERAGPEISESHLQGILIVEEERTYPHVRRPFFGGDGVVLRRPHRELAQAVLGAELPQPREPGAGLLRRRRGRRHRRQSLYVVTEIGGEVG